MVLLLDLALPTSRAAAQPDPGYKWISLGDSYSAGVGREGGLSGLNPSANRCRRQEGGYAMPALSRLTGIRIEGGQPEQHACISAKITDYYNAQEDRGLFGIKDVQPQQNHLDDEVDIVTITMGGNDLNFSTIIKDCIGFSWQELLLVPGCDDFESLDELDLQGLEDELFNLYIDIRAQIAGDGRLFVLSYPELFSDPDLWGERPTCENVPRADARLINDASLELSKTVKRAVVRANNIFGNVHFVDFHPFSIDRGLCRPNYSSYIRGLSPSAVTDSFHPTNAGYEAMGALLASCMNHVFATDGFCDELDSNPTSKPADAVTTALIVDASGSMQRNDPENRRLLAGSSFLTASDQSDRVSVIEFDGQARINAANLTISRSSDDLEEALQSIGSSGASTNLGVAIESGCEVLSVAEGDGPKAALFFTDGSGGYSDEVRCFVEQDWPLYTFGLGTNADNVLLERIANETGGNHRSLASVDDLVCEFQQVRSAIAGGAQGDCEATGQIMPSETVSHAFRIGSDLARWTTTLTWPGSDIELALVSPSGRRIDRTTVADDVTRKVGPGFDTVAIESPEAGDWQVEAFGADVAQSGTEYSLSTVELPVPTNSSPVPSFSSAAGQLANTVVLDASASSDRDGTLTHFNWRLPDGTTLAGERVTVAFKQSGAKSVSLTVTDNNGATESITQSVQVGPALHPALLRVRARGDSGSELVEIRVNGNVTDSFIASTTWTLYEPLVPLGTSIHDLEVAFTNNGIADNGDRNLEIDYVELGAERFESEASSTFSQGAWTSATGCAPGFKYSQKLWCNGFFRYAPSNDVEVLGVRARGDVGSEQLEVRVAGQVQGSFTASTAWETYSVTVPSGTAISDVEVAFINNGVAANGDRNVEIDYIEFAGVRHESEAAGVFSQGAWTPSNGCGPGFKQSQKLWCNGYFRYPGA
jgi:lysophospholipase L1-like esterase